MINRHTKRWCPECKMMVFSRGHEHGQGAAGLGADALTNNADFMMAKDAAEKIVADAAPIAKQTAEKEFWRRLGLKP